MKVWYPSNLTPPELKEAGFAGAEVVPMETDPRSGVAVVRVQVDEADEALVIDTGASNTVIPASTARRLKLKPTSKAIFSTVQGDIVRSIGKVKRLAIGRMVLRDIEVAFAEGDKLPPHLGRDVLRRFRVLIDKPQQRVYFKPVGGDGAPQPISP